MNDDTVPAPPIRRSQRDSRAAYHHGEANTSMSDRRRRDGARRYSRCLDISSHSSSSNASPIPSSPTPAGRLSRQSGARRLQVVRKASSIVEPQTTNYAEHSAATGLNSECSSSAYVLLHRNGDEYRQAMFERELEANDAAVAAALAEQGSGKSHRPTRRGISSKGGPKTRNRSNSDMRDIVKQKRAESRKSTNSIRSNSGSTFIVPAPDWLIIGGQSGVHTGAFMSRSSMVTTTTTTTTVTTTTTTMGQYDSYQAVAAPAVAVATTANNMPTSTGEYDDDIELSSIDVDEQIRLLEMYSTNNRKKGPEDEKSSEKLSASSWHTPIDSTSSYDDTLESGTFEYPTATVDQVGGGTATTTTTTANTPAPSHKEDLIEVAPGFMMPLRKAKDMWRDVKNGNVVVTRCCCCSNELTCSKDDGLVLCPECWVFNPVDEEELLRTATMMSQEKERPSSSLDCAKSLKGETTGDEFLFKFLDCVQVDNNGFRTKNGARQRMTVGIGVKTDDLLEWLKEDTSSEELVGGSMH